MAKRKIKHDTTVKAESEGPSFNISVTVSNNDTGTVFIRDKDWHLAMRNSMQIPLEDIPTLIEELQWVLSRFGEME